MKLKKPKYTQAEADRLFSLVIRQKGCCLKCGSKFSLQCAHIISRTYKAVRYNFDNAVCLCQKCHFYYTYHYLEWENFIDEQFGKEHRENLRKLALNYQKPDYQVIIEGLNGQLILPS